MSSVAVGQILFDFCPFPGHGAKLIEGVRVSVSEINGARRVVPREVGCCRVWQADCTRATPTKTLEQLDCRFHKVKRERGSYASEACALIMIIVTYAHGVALNVAVCQHTKTPTHPNPHAAMLAIRHQFPARVAFSALRSLVPP